MHYMKHKFWRVTILLTTNTVSTQILTLFLFDFQIRRSSSSDMYICIEHHNKFHRKGGRCGCTCSGKLCVT